MTSRPLPPGKNGFPFIGETLSFIFDPEFADQRFETYGPIFRTNILGQPTVVMGGAEANKFILASHFEHFSWRDGWPANFKELLGESLFLQEGEEHDRNRKLLMPAFHGPALQSYFATMVQLCSTHLDRWAQLGELTLLPPMKEMTFEIASVLLLGSEPGEETTRLSRLFSDLTKGLFAFPIPLPWTTFGKALRGRDLLLDHLSQEIKRRRQGEPTQDTLGLLLQTQDEEGNGLKDDEIKVQALLMLFAGHETTTSMLTCLCMALAQHPNILAQAQQEQSQFGDEPLSFEQCRRMPFLNQILKEVERLYPPVAGGFRGVTKEFEFRGYHVPAGWKLLYQMRAAHQDPDIYHDPDRFDPDRFSPDRNEQKNADFSLVGFGGGPRVCLGLAFAQLEMKIFASLLLRHYRWELLPHQDLSLSPIPSLHPRSGLQISLTKTLTSIIAG
ncbi:MAG: cytochrome P450 [Synechococcaceae cyanobacterium RL_1_2]|nr:cytochrome P450 [Synechococcaceae cyanobacterium RL_1_2]